MAHFMLDPGNGDPRVGTFNEDGSIAVWPSVDMAGNLYSHTEATVKRVLDVFVVLPVGFDHPDHTYSVAPTSTTQRPKKG